MQDAFVWCYPRDLEAEGVESALARLSGEMAVDGLCVAALTGDVHELRPRLTDGPRILFDTSAAQFHPEANRYSGTRLRPVAAGWFKSRDPLAKIADAANKEDMRLRLWASCCDNAAMVEKHPTAASVNAFGDTGRRWLCPSNPDVRFYMATLIEELSQRYQPAAIELWTLGFASDLIPDDVNIVQGIPQPDWVAELMRWCFCPSCRQRASDADVDSDRAADLTVDLLQQAFKLQPSLVSTINELLNAHPILEDYRKVRRDGVVSLLKTLRQKTDRRLVLKQPYTTRLDAQLIAALAEQCDALMLLTPPDDNHAWQEQAKRLNEIIGGPSRLEIGLRTHPPAVTEGPDLVAEAHHASSAGHTSIGFFNDGLTPQPALEWIRQAIRYARRES